MMKNMCAACMCAGKGAPQDWSFCSGYVFGRLDANRSSGGIVLCEKHRAMRSEFEKELRGQIGEQVKSG